MVVFSEKGYLQLCFMFCIGGIDMRLQLEVVKYGVYIVVVMLGWLKDMLVKKKMNFDNCKYFMLDEVDRFVDLGFEEDIREVFDYFRGQR